MDSTTNPIESLNKVNELSNKSPNRVIRSEQTITETNEKIPKSPNPSIRSTILCNRFRPRTNDSDSGSVVSSSSYRWTTLSPLQRKWMSSAAKCDYNSLVLCLESEPELSAYKDFTNGFNALHWAAKFGRKDIIELIGGQYKMSPDLKSHGGYTALHIAAQHQNHDIWQLLIQKYDANPNIRDHSGHKPDYYLKTLALDISNSASNTENAKSKSKSKSKHGHFSPSSSVRRLSGLVTDSMSQLKKISRRSSIGLFENKPKESSELNTELNSELSSPEKLRNYESDSD